MPHTLVEIFTHAQLLDFKNRNSWARRRQRARRLSRHVLSEPGHAQRPAPLYAAAETGTGKEDAVAVRRVRHCKDVGLQEWPLAGRATVPRVLYGIGLRMSLRRRTILSKCIRAPARVAFRHSHFARLLRQNHRSSFCLGRGENLVIITRFGKPLFANMHHHVHAVAGALRKPKLHARRPAPRRLRWMVSDVIDAEFALRSCQ